MLEITVELNTSITSVIDRRASGPWASTYDPETMVQVQMTRISTCLWVLLLRMMILLPLHSRKMAAPSRGRSRAVNLTLGNDLANDQAGFQVTIGGIKANASTVGDGEDVTAVVSVAGGVVHGGSLKLADVATGLKVKVEGADVLQCRSR